MSYVDRQHLQFLLAREEEVFIQKHPQSKRLAQKAQQHLLGGVPMNWMVKWGGSFPIFVKEARDAYFTDVDGNTYLDLCLGDTGAMTGHAPDATVRAVIEQAQRGMTFMLPIEDAIWIGEELYRRFGLDYWQFALTATDANRFAIRLARQITGRSMILIFNWCYHGTVDETFITLNNGVAIPRRGNVGAPINQALTTRVVEFNDIAALEAALEPCDVACVLAEPVMTNIGIVHPAPDFHDALREITRRTGTILIMDETHTICTGVGGYTAAHHLEPDMLTVGKPIGGGVPAAVYGMTEEIAERVRHHTSVDKADTGGIGGTLAGNALSLAAIRATLSEVLTQSAYDYTIPLATYFTQGVQAVIDEFALPWHVTQLGCRAEYWFIQNPPKNGGQAAAVVDDELDRYMHLASLNRGILMTPFHNMALISPQTTRADIDYHTEVFRDIVGNLVGVRAAV
jgi:glutamate-1-semialdehyde 2,1-aminomutase